jgi:hypothetical protein
MLVPKMVKEKAISVSTTVSLVRAVSDGAAEMAAREVRNLQDIRGR